MNKNVIVAHPQQQHSYYVASALKKEGLLKSYITTVYYNENKLIYKFMAVILRKNSNFKRMVNRKCSDLDDFTDIVQFIEILGLLLTALIRVDKKRIIYFKIQNYVDEKFGIKVARYASKLDNQILIMFDQKALTCFDYIKKEEKNIIKILDMSSGIDNYTEGLLKSQIEKYSRFEDNFDIYKKNIGTEKNLKAINELQNSDYFVVASSFTKRSLIYNGVEEDRIFVIPYGIDINKYNAKNEYKIRDKIIFLYTGGIHPRKGIIDLLEASKSIHKLDKSVLMLAGQIVGGNDIVDDYKEYYKYIGHLRKDEMNNVYIQSDVLIQPSLHDGFSFSILEGMASGLPIICTHNTVGTDIVKDGYNGFVIKAGDDKELSKKMKYFIDNPEQVEIMGRRSREIAEKFTWKEYGKSYSDMIKKINNEFS